MTAEIILLADRRPHAVDRSSEMRAEIRRLRCYARRYMRDGNLERFSSAALDDLEQLISKHSMVIEYVDPDGGIAGSERIILSE